MAGRAIRSILTEAGARLKVADVAEPRLDARLLLAAAAGLEPSRVLPHADVAVDSGTLARFERMLARRAAGEPVSRIVGRRAFWTLDLELSPDTLDPRPDSETLIEALIETSPDREAALDILDLGTGSGCLLLAALAAYPNATGVGVDLAPGAIATAARNADANGLAERARFVAGGWDAARPARFDVILANPPYIPTGEIDSLAVEVRRHDPRLALDGGADGLAAYREIAALLPDMLRPEGLALLEIGAGQADAVCTILNTAGLTIRGVRADLSGIGRCVIATMKPGGFRDVSSEA